MSKFFTGQGKEILKKREEEEQKQMEQERQKQEQDEIKRLRKYLKSGEKINVVLPNAETYVEFWSHTSFKLSKDYQIYACVCTRHIQPDAYDKAVNYLYKVKKQLEGKELETAELITKELKAKRRYMFGFWNPKTGQPIIVETTGNQGDILVDRIIEFEEDDKLDCELQLERVGTGTDTKYKLTVVRGPNRKPVKVDVSKFGDFDLSLFEKMVYTKDDEWKVRDLVKLGFDVTKIGYEKPEDVAGNTEIKQNNEPKQKEEALEINDDDLPF